MRDRKCPAQCSAVKVGLGERAALAPGVRPERVAGFTLIEILIVISIIALLSSFVLVAVSRGRKAASEALVTTQVNSLSSALQRYVQDEAEYPAMGGEADPEANDFPKLYNALLGERRPNGPGGRSAPYVHVKEDQVAVYDADSERYDQATKAEIDDPDVDKYLLDEWGNPYVYRCNRGKKRESWMHNSQGADIYSLGPNGIDDTSAESEKSDDIGNW